MSFFIKLKPRTTSALIKNVHGLNMVKTERGKTTSEYGKCANNNNSKEIIHEILKMKKCNLK